MFTDRHLREGGTNLGSFPVGGWLTTPTSPPVYGPVNWDHDIKRGMISGDDLKQPVMSEVFERETMVFPLKQHSHPWRSKGMVKTHILCAWEIGIWDIGMQAFRRTIQFTILIIHALWCHPYDV